MNPKFELGATVITRNAIDTLHPHDVLPAIVRHASGDWGDLDSEDKQANERALHNGGRLMSQYRDRNNVKFWIITEADRSLTTVLLPEDY